MGTYQGVFASGWKATVRAGSKKEARERLTMTGRGEQFKMVSVSGSEFNVWGKDTDDDYTEGE